MTSNQAKAHLLFTRSIAILSIGMGPRYDPYLFVNIVHRSRFKSFAWLRKKNIWRIILCFSHIQIACNIWISMLKRIESFTRSRSKNIQQTSRNLCIISYNCKCNWIVWKRYFTKLLFFFLLIIFFVSLYERGIYRIKLHTKL